MTACSDPWARRLQALVGLGAVALTAAALGQSGPASDLVIRLAPGASVADVCERYGLVLVSELSARGLYRVAPPGVSTNLAFFFLEEDPEIEAAETDAVAEVVSGHTQSFFFRMNGEYTNQYALAQMACVPGQNASDGAGVTVAVLDTGYFDHPAISAAIMPGFNFVDDSADTYDLGLGCDSNGNGIPDELAGHGTFLAGLVSLIAPHSNILPVKVLDSDGQGTVFSVAAGIYYATDHGAQVINMSLSFPRESQVVTDAITYARDHGVVVVAAVGNDNQSDPVFPAAGAGVLAVAATTPLDTKAWFSDFGPHVDLCAPGVSVVSTLPNGMYGIGNGTSFSTAWVSGAAALVKATLPNPTPDRVMGRLKRTSSRVTDTMFTFRGQLGAGRLNVGAALAGKATSAAAVPDEGR